MERGHPLRLGGERELWAAADLRHLKGFLAAVARSQQEAALPLSDAVLAELAARQSCAVADLAAALEQALG